MCGRFTQKLTWREIHEIPFWAKDLKIGARLIKVRNDGPELME